MSLALVPQIVSQASQYFRFSEKQAICEGCFARQSICSVVSLHSGMFGTTDVQLSELSIKKQNKTKQQQQQEKRKNELSVKRMSFSVSFSTDNYVLL